MRSWLEVFCIVWSSWFLLWFHVIAIVLYRLCLISSSIPFVCSSSHPTIYSPHIQLAIHIHDKNEWINEWMKHYQTGSLYLTSSVLWTLRSCLHRWLWLLGVSLSFQTYSLYIQAHMAYLTSRRILSTPFSLWKVSNTSCEPSILVYTICFTFLNSCIVLCTVGLS